MSIDTEVSVVGSADVMPPRREFAPMAEAAPMRAPGAPSGRLIALWVLVIVIVLTVILIAVEPLFQQREQGLLLTKERAAIDRAANQATGLGGVEVATTAPEFGSPVGILEMGPIGVQQVVIEGASAAIMQNGPGHVPGTSGLGQPGNAVVAGRATLFGAPFADLSQLAVGDKLAASTTQGQVVYEVVENGSVQLTSGKASASAGTSTSSSSSSTDSSSATGAATTSAEYTPILGDGRISLDTLYGSTADDRLTLVTSASAVPFNSAQARVVIATMVGKPYAPTPQNGRTNRQTGTTSDTSRWPFALLAAMCLGSAIVGAVLLYRRSSAKVAYLLTVPPLLVFAVLAAETVSQMLPAWL